LPNIICADTFKTAINGSIFKAPSITYGWKFITNTNNSINDSTLATPTFTFINNQTGSDSTNTIRLRVTSVDGCIHDTTNTITILKRPLSVFTVPQTMCGPANVLITNATSLTSTWNWSSIPALSFTTATSQNPNVLFPINATNDSINYRIQLTATRVGASCVDTTSRLVTIYPKPKANFTTITKDSCGPRLVNFTNTSDAKNGESLSSMSYLWTYLNTNFTDTNTAGTFTNTGVVDALYNISLIATSKHGCIDSAKTNVTVWPNPKADFSSTIYSSCAPFLINNSIVTLTQYPIANSNYLWQILDKLGNIISSSVGINIPVFTITTPNETFYYRLITSHSRGCKPDTLTRMFVTIPNPVPNFTMSDSAGCTPLTVNFTNTSTVGVSSAWTMSNGATPANTNPFNVVFNNISNTNDATYTAKLVITAGTGCKDSITKTITVYPKPKAIFTLPTNACALSSLNPNNKSIFKIGNVKYGWSIIEPTATIIDDSTSANPVFSFGDNQLVYDSLFNFILLVTSVDGCIDRDTQNIRIFKRPLALFTVPPTFCGVSNVNILNSTALNSNWSWNSTPMIGFNSSTIKNPTVTFPLNNTNDSINYNIKLIATRAGTTCVDSTTRLVTIYPQPKADFLIITKDSCGPRMVNFTNNSTAKNGEPFSTLSFLWTYLNKNVSTTNTAATYNNTGVIDSIYYTRLIATSKHGCKDTLTDTVIVRTNAKASFSYTLNLSCAPFNLTASNIQAVNYAGANLSYQWYANNLFIGNGITFPGYTISNQNDSVLIKLVTISKNGCKNDSMQVWFRTIANPVPNFTAIDSIGCTPLLVNFNNTSTPNNGLSYRWEFGSLTNQSILKNPSFTFYNYGILDTTILVKLVITAGGTGCSDSITKPIVIKPLPRPFLNLSDSVLCYPNLLNVNNLSANIPIYDITSFKWKVIGPDAVSILNDTASSNTVINFPDNKTGANKFYQIWLKIRSIYGCIDSVKKTIRIPTRPISSFNFSADSSCAPVIISTNNTAQYANTFSWTSIDPNVIINNPNMINTSIKFPSHKGTIDSIYPIKLVSQTIAGCFDTIIKPFKVFPLPISKFTLDKDSGCSPLSVTFYNSTTVKTPASYFWNFGDGNTQINNADTFTKTFIGSVYQDTSYIIQLISTSANGCKDTTYKTIKVKASAFAKIKLNDTLICSNAVNPTKLTILNKSFGSVDTFYWDFGDGTQLITTIDSTINHPYPIEGTYTIILKATNSCKTSYDTSKITVQTPPTVNFSKSDSIGCSPLAVSFSNLSTNIYKAKFLWNFGNGSTSNLITPPTVNYLQSRTQDTTYYMSLTVSNFCGVYQKNDSIKVLPKPISIFLTSADSGCSPLPVYMINQSVGLPINYKWYFGNGDSSLRFAPLQTPITYRTIDTISYFKIKLIATNTCGIDSMEKIIKVFPNTVKSFFTTSGNAGCEGLMVSFYDNSTGGNSISWNFGDGITSLLKNPTHQYNKQGTFYAYQYVNNGCSFDTSFVIISVLPNPQFTISKSAPNICIKNPVQFNANLKDSGVITWYFGDGDTSNAFNPIHNYNSSGKKIITVMLKSFYNSCISIKYDTINVLPIPVITLTADTNQACAYHLFKLSASSPQTNIFNWDFGDNNTGAGSSISHLYQFGGTYTVKILAQTSFGCIDSTTKQLVVFPVPTSAFSYTPKDTCNGPVTVKFTNLSVGANNFLWNFGNGNNSTNVNPTTIYSNVGSYPIQLISNNQFSCYDTSKSEYFVYQTPKAALDFTPESGCPPLQVTFINKSQFGTSYLWEFGDGETDTSFSPNHTYKLTGKYKVKLTVKAGTVCYDSINSLKEVTVFAKPTSIFDTLIDRTAKPYGKIEFKNKSVNATNYLWIYGDGFESKEKDPNYKYKRAGSFQVLLIAYSKDNCIDSSFIKIEIPEYYRGLYVPNAFTPEYGIDEVREFKPSGMELKYYHLKIFSKWGELLWESNVLNNGQPKVGWNGIDLKGNKCMQGSYIWTIEAEFTDGTIWEGMKFGNGKSETRGNVTLIR
jgi:PKD repeat protein